MALVGSAIAALAVGYLFATTYLVLRDDLLGAAAARQARMQQAYEDRISALRAQVDRITSRQMLDQQVMENKVGELLERQSQLTRRHGRLGPILERLGGEPDRNSEAAPLPAETPGGPDLRAALRLGDYDDAVPAPATPRQRPATYANAFWSVGASAGSPGLSAADRSDLLFLEINRALRDIEAEQLAGLETIAANIYDTADQIVTALEGTGLRVEPAESGEALGGPFIPLDQSSLFEMRMQELDAALDRLDAVRETARRMPVFNPAPGFSVSSNFGVRRDPILRTPAHHSGIDFRAPQGAEIKSAGAGTVISAGWNGGYGRMVEIDHGGGYTTRYAHMSRIAVSVGDRVQTGSVLGRVGSTGRSTGPHLHYEVRRQGAAIDPRPFLRAGRRLAELL